MKQLTVGISLLSLLVLLVVINRYRKVVVVHNPLGFVIDRVAGAPAPISTTKVVPFLSPTTTTTSTPTTIATPAVKVQKTAEPTVPKVDTAQTSSLVQNTVADSRPYSGPEKVLPTEKVKGEADCKDPNFPFFDPKTSTCVQCFESSFNCLTGFQRCYQGRCVVKNSPQCSYYPIGGTGGAIHI